MNREESFNTEGFVPLSLYGGNMRKKEVSRVLFICLMLFVIVPVAFIIYHLDVTSSIDRALILGDMVEANRLENIYNDIKTLRDIIMYLIQLIAFISVFIYIVNREDEK